MGSKERTVWLVLDVTTEKLQLRRGSTPRLSDLINSLSFNQLRGCKLLVGLAGEGGVEFIVVTCINGSSPPGM